LFLKGIDFNGRKHIKRSILIQAFLKNKMLNGQNYWTTARRITRRACMQLPGKKIGRDVPAYYLNEDFEIII